jgi:serine protease Do
MFMHDTLRRIPILAALCLVITHPPAWGQASDKNQTKAAVLALQEAFVGVADEVEPSVVTITAKKINKGAAAGEEGIPGLPFGRRSPRDFRSEGTGSGVILSADGWILTNDHVISGADRVTVKLHDGREFVGSVRRDTRSDLALIKITASDLRPAKLGNSDAVKVGHWAIAIGSPYRYEGSLSVGVISSLSRKQEIAGRGEEIGRLYPSMIQTDAAINPGNSGGPLVNIEGEVIGINTAIESESGGSVGIGFAIPVNMVKFVVEQLKTKGRVSYGYLGVDPETVTPRLAAAYKTPGGALVLQEPDPSTPAGRAGIHVEDVITEIGGRPIFNEADLRLTVSRIPPGTKIPVQIIRSGKPIRLEVTVEEAPNPTPAAGSATIEARIGIEVTPLSKEAAERVGWVETKGGVVVKSRDEASGAGDSDLRPGDVILTINDTPTPSVEAFLKSAKNLKSGDVVRIRYQGRRGRATFQRVTIFTID